jgi:hypothetical protein
VALVPCRRTRQRARTIGSRSDQSSPVSALPPPDFCRLLPLVGEGAMRKQSWCVWLALGPAESVRHQTASVGHGAVGRTCVGGASGGRSHNPRSVNFRPTGPSSFLSSSALLQRVELVIKRGQIRAPRPTGPPSSSARHCDHRGGRTPLRP